MLIDAAERLGYDDLRLIYEGRGSLPGVPGGERYPCLLYTSDAADERSSVDLGGRRIIQKKTNGYNSGYSDHEVNTTQKHTR